MPRLRLNLKEAMPVLRHTNPMANPGGFAYTVRQTGNIVRIVGEVTSSCANGGAKFVGLCPFHRKSRRHLRARHAAVPISCSSCKAWAMFLALSEDREHHLLRPLREVAQKLGIACRKDLPSRPKRSARAGRGRCWTPTSHVGTGLQRRTAARRDATHAREYLASRGLTPNLSAEFRMSFAPDRDSRLSRSDAEAVRTRSCRDSGLSSFEGCRRRGGRALSRRVSPGPTDSSRPVGESRRLCCQRGRRTPPSGNRADVGWLLLKFREPHNVSHHQRIGKGDCLHRAHVLDRREGRPEVLEFTGDPRFTPSRASYSISTRRRKRSANSTTPSWSKARWIALRCIRRGCTMIAVQKRRHQIQARLWAASAKTSW